MLLVRIQPIKIQQKLKNETLDSTLFYSSMSPTTLMYPYVSSNGSCLFRTNIRLGPDKPDEKPYHNFAPIISYATTSIYTLHINLSFLVNFLLIS